MKKDIQSYLYPVFAFIVIVGCDYVFCRINIVNNNNQQVLNWIMIVVYNYLAIMSILTLMIARYKDPGFIPKDY